MRSFARSSLCIVAALAFLIVLAGSNSAFSAEYSLGGGLGFAPDYEGSDDYEPVPLLFATATMDSGQHVELKGLSLRANLIPDSIWRAGPVLQYRPERDDVDNNKVDDLKKVDAAVELGAYGGFKIENWASYLTFVQDIADAHDGWLLTLRGEYQEKPLNYLQMTIGAEITYASDDYMETYFEISPSDAARSGLDTYKADAGIKDFGLDLTLNYTPWEHWGLIGLIKYNRLVSDAKDSPVVDDEGSANQFLLGVAANYRF